ncbi:MAG: GTP-sensing pleiotropic transcriptional regulator CodY [Synergistaceae bacterium]|jgi:transcriptional pleiotropic repressor|nr:GTP-sensing pleiotropic transcriptional regulator CodY [Synergistaceae bacterium]
MIRKVKSSGKAGDKRFSAESAPVIEQEYDWILRDLLEKTRQVGRALQSRREGDPLDYIKLAKLLSEFSTANVYILGRDGKVLGYAWVPEYSSQKLSDVMKNGYLPEDFIEKVNRCRELEVNDDDAYLFDDQERSDQEKHLMYVPIFGAAAERLGTVMLVRFSQLFETIDILLAEYLGTLVGIEMLNDRNRNIEELSRDRIAVQMAMRALSYSEVESMKHIMAELDGYEGVAIASKVADRVGVTRSVIVNALRKLESAGLIESRSLGMKGTYIKVLSPLFVEELGAATSARVNY